MNIAADHLSGEDYGRQRDIYTQLRGNEPGPTLLYVTPEKVSSRDIQYLHFNKQAWIVTYLVIMIVSSVADPEHFSTDPDPFLFWRGSGFLEG